MSFGRWIGATACGNFWWLGEIAITVDAKKANILATRGRCAFTAIAAFILWSAQDAKFNSCEGMISDEATRSAYAHLMDSMTCIWK